MINTFSKPSRCQSITQAGTICRVKKCTLYKINGKYHCRIHFNYNYVKYILIIQSYWRSYYSRRKLNNIFKKLPCDIQRIVQWYINKDEYYLGLTDSINQILRKRATKINTISTLPSRYIDTPLNVYNRFVLSIMIYEQHIDLYNIDIIKHYEYIISTCRLYNKYKYWDNVKVNTIFNVLDNTLLVINEMLQYNVIFDSRQEIEKYNQLQTIIYNTLYTSES